MGRHNARVGTLTIAGSATDSQALSTLQFGKAGLGAAVGITIYAPAAVPGVITVQVLPYGDTVWRTLQSGGADVTIAAAKAVVISPPPFGDLRLHTATAGAEAVFFVDAQIDTSGSMGTF